MPKLPELRNFPQRITLELTNKCNLNCTFCPRKIMEKNLGLLDLSLAKRLLDEMAYHLPVILVPFFRGEPLMHPDWFEILQYAKGKGVGPIQLTTNGTCMTKDIAQCILDLQVDFISFSLDTIDPELYERTRLGANYEKVRDNILYLLELKSFIGSRLPEVQVSAVDTQQHHDKLDDFVAFWRPIVDRVRVYIEHSTDGHPGSILADSLSPIRRQPCHKLFGDMVIYWNGDVALCNHDWNRVSEDRIGNVCSQTIAEVWNSKRYNLLRAQHQDGNLDKVYPCDHCDHWKMYYSKKGFLGELYTKGS
jgi:radical SAM protein with 4Fe4S-binding SPASM domain